MEIENLESIGNSYKEKLSNLMEKADMALANGFIEYQKAISSTLSNVTKTKEDIKNRSIIAISKEKERRAKEAFAQIDKAFLDAGFKR
ncbi:MAG TPA: hypothetical protein DEF61_05630 [Firmicutes bacterium]|nr:hypothetical protein [Bacillota bacterium]